MSIAGETIAMVAIEFMEVSISTISKAAMKQGMSQLIYTFYSNALGIVILLASVCIFYRKRAWTPLTLCIICRIFLLGFISFGVQMFLNAGIKYASPTLSSAMVDLTPAFTFLLAIIFRMEKLDFRFQSSQAKSVGTLVSIAGALTVTLYKGLPITSLPSQNNPTNESLLTLPSNWVIGGILCAAGALCLSVLYIVQTWIIKDYPEELIVTVIACIFVTLLSAIFSLIVEQDPNAWTLKLDMKSISILFSGIFAVSLRSVVHTWACRKKGPVYTAIFKPLGMVIAMVLGVSFLGDTLYVGSVIGAVIISFGFYAVIWGKAQEENMVKEEGNSSLESPSPEVPLLGDKGIEI